ncbi:MAG TPA: carboxypeptidase regulatory-like domain-containing protein [Longimicrobium sp.]|nr:carboxypeptidase regulatory-like domain-containing protein [Longimicrobium sp.]
MITTIAGLALLALAARPVAAQSISGRVLETRTSWPVPGATVTVLDVAGAPVGYSHTDASGGYRVELREPGRYQLRVERVGYRPRALALTDVPEGRNVRRDLRLTPGAARPGQESIGGRGLIPPGAAPMPVPGVPPSTDGGPSTARAPQGDATAARPAPRVVPRTQPRRGESGRPAARQPRTGGRSSGGGEREGAKRTP